MVPSVSLNRAVSEQSPPSGTAPSLTTVPPAGSTSPCMEHVHPNWTEVATLHGSPLALMGLALRGLALGPAPCTFRCLSRRCYSDEGRLIQFWAPRSQPVAPGDTRACRPKGEAPEEAPELVFLLRCPLSPCLPGALEASLQLSGPPSSWRRCCLLPGADPPGLGVPAGGPFPRTRPPVHARGLACVLLFRTCTPPQAHVVTAPHGAGRSFRGHPRLLSSSHGELVLMALVLS